MKQSPHCQSCSSQSLNHRLHVPMEERHIHSDAWTLLSCNTKVLTLREPRVEATKTSAVDKRQIDGNVVGGLPLSGRAHPPPLPPTAFSDKGIEMRGESPPTHSPLTKTTPVHCRRSPCANKAKAALPRAFPPPPHAPRSPAARTEPLSPPPPPPPQQGAHRDQVRPRQRLRTQRLHSVPPQHRTGLL